MKKNTIKRAVSQGKNAPKVGRVFMGFTLQFRNNVPDVKKIRDNIQKSVNDILSQAGFKPEESNYSWDDINPDLVDITISPNPEWPPEPKKVWQLTYELLRQCGNINYHLAGLKTQTTEIPETSQASDATEGSDSSNIEDNPVIYVEPKFALQFPSDTADSPEQDSPETPENPEAIKKVLHNPEWHIKKMHIRASFKLTKQSFENLRNENIPDNILEGLKTIENQDFLNERTFLNAVEKQIKKEQTVRYKELILKHAHISRGAWGLFTTFELTQRSFALLLEKNIPQEVLKKLRLLQNQKIRGEEEFVNKINEYIGEEQTHKYKDSILELAQCIIKKPGQDIIIAHPDTGFLRHPELEKKEKIYKYTQDGAEYDKHIKEKKLLAEEKVSMHVIEKVLEHVKKTALKQVQNLSKIAKKKFPVNTWHGTAIASLMISPEGPPTTSNLTKDPYVTGIAPGAKLKRYYLGPTTFEEFEFFAPGLIKAINDAAKDPNVRVISISLGGYPALSLHRAIINAQRKGIIVVASAGNNIPFAIWPSAYSNVISVASSDFEAQTLAKHSARGSRIDVAVPSEYIMVAVPTLDQNGNLKYIVEPRSGTSYAAPIVAGIAALWLSYHEWEELLKKYKIPAKIPLVFDKLLRESCEAPKDWDTRRWGTGIVNARKLLEAELPDADDPYIQESLAYQEIDHIDLDRGGVDTFAYLFEEVLSTPWFSKSLIQVSPFLETSLNINQVFSRIFKGTPTGKKLRQYLRTFGREIAFHMGTDVALYRQMEEVLRSLVGLSEKTFEENLQEMVTQLKAQASEYLHDYLV